MAHGCLEHVEGDILVVVLLGPLEDTQHGTAPADEVAAELRFPSDTALRPVVLVSGGDHKLVVGDRLAVVAAC